MQEETSQVGTTSLPDECGTKRGSQVGAQPRAASRDAEAAWQRGRELAEEQGRGGVGVGGMEANG
jgi:hypothetical protein